MRILKNKWFRRFAKQQSIDDEMLCSAVDEAEEGLIEADLGRHLIKQRVARKGQGKRGGFRVYVAYKRGVRAIFLYGYPKSERENLEDDELETFQQAASELIALSDAKIDTAVKGKVLFEVKCNDEEVQE